MELRAIAKKALGLGAPGAESASLSTQAKDATDALGAVNPASDNVLLVLLIDSSGSMSPHSKEVVSGVNAILQRHRDSGQNTIVLAEAFNNETYTIIDFESVYGARDLTTWQYMTAYSTHMLDAIGRTIARVERVCAGLSAEHRPKDIYFTIITDGYSVGDVEYTEKSVKRLVSRKAKEGWSFMFLGMDEYAEEVARRLGIPARQSASFNAENIGAAFESVGTATITETNAHLLESGEWKAGLAKGKRAE